MGDFNIIFINTHTAQQAGKFLINKTQFEKIFTLSSSRIHISVSDFFLYIYQYEN